MNLFFSVILPTFNRCHLISKAIISLINQTYNNWELIIIDDGSTDNTREIVEKYIFKDSRIKYYYQKNSERSIARNNGIKKAKGDWICFLDSDDFYHESHLEKFKELIILNKYSTGLYFSGLSMNSYCNKPMQYVESKKNIEFILLNSFSTPRSCISINITKKYFFDENIRIGEDTELWVRIAKDYPIFFHQYKTVVQIEHEERSINSDVFYCDLKTKRKILNILDTNEISKKIRKDIISKCYFNIAKYEIILGNKSKSILYLLLSIIIQPFHQQNKFKINIILSLLISLKKTKLLIK